MKINDIKTRIAANPATVFRYRGTGVIVRGFEMESLNPRRPATTMKVRVSVVSASGDVFQNERLVMPGQISHVLYDSITDYVEANKAAQMAVRVENAKREADVAAMSRMFKKEVREVLAARLRIDESIIEVRYTGVTITIPGVMVAELMAEQITHA